MGEIESTNASHTGLSDQQKHLLSRLDLLLPYLADIHNTLDKKLQFNFTLMSAIVSVLIIGNISWFDQSKLESNEYSSLYIFGLCFLVVALAPVYAHWPRNRVFPITPNWDNLSEWWDYTPKEYSEQVRLSYESLYDADKKVRERKALLVMVSHFAVVIGLAAAFYEGVLSLGLFSVS